MKAKETILIAILFLIYPVRSWSQQRVVLIEQFTNSGCPPCAGNTPVIASYVNANPSTVLMLAYHTSFPYLDSMYHENPLQSNARVAYYGVVGVTNSRVDGNYFSGNPVPSLSAIISNRLLDAPEYGITFTANTLGNNQLNASVVFESIAAGNQNQSLTAHVVVAEKNVLKSAYTCCAGANTETEYPWVVRRMLPDAGGTTLINPAQGASQVVNVSWTANNIKDIAEVRLIAFVQNTVTKEVYQAAIASPTITTGVIQVENTGDQLFQVISPVRNNQMELQLQKASSPYRIKIYNVLGNCIYDNSASNESRYFIETESLKSGIYFVAVENQNSKSVKKVLIP